MYAATSPSKATKVLRFPANAVHGVARIGYAHNHGTTRLAGLEQRSPLRVLFPNPATGDLPLAAIVNTSGGIVGGDRLDICLSVAEGGSALVAAQAAEKVYRSTGADCRIEVDIEVAPGAWLESLPQETILFEGARLRRRSRIEVAPAGRLLAGEILVFGRVASGERLTRGLVRDAWEVCRDGRLVWADALHMEDDIAAVLAAPAAFADARAYATAIFVADDAASRLNAAREFAMRDGIRCGATCIGDVLIARWLGPDPLEVRAAFEDYWTGMRQLTAGLPAALPRLWHI
ncbi:MAG: urease accessory protein UreD [Alphaproteobacteria bacterium]|jgi:urease accessory protein|nr:urease accessory protein UreD [Alphaproteobacteria bacterium]